MVDTRYYSNTLFLNILPTKPELKEREDCRHSLEAKFGVSKHVKARGGHMARRKNEFVTIGFAAALLIFVALPSQIWSTQADSILGRVAARPVLHHILIEVADIARSLKFYRDCLGLSLTSQANGFATLESANAGIYLWQNHWGWEDARASQKSRGIGMYPHFEVENVAAMVERFRKAGYSIVQEPRNYDWGTEAFVRDPDGYIIALVKLAPAR
ncbi:MAG TPA: VOC family protein [Chitinivibrionales bacterium]|nr:VOC family protein [Chitinivibrionales bacterium]